MLHEFEASMIYIAILGQPRLTNETFLKKIVEAYLKANGKQHKIHLDYIVLIDCIQDNYLM